MLSRVAESIYWMGRYLERAESVARLVDVNLHLTLDSAADCGDQWEPLIRTVGSESLFLSRYGVAERDNVMRFLTFEMVNPNSIIACARGARENARSVRDVISSEMWEQTNRLYGFLKTYADTDYALVNSHDFYTGIKMAAHLFDGIADATMSHGDAWHFLRLGKMIERADTTSRILDVKYFILLPRWQGVGSPVDTVQWAALLKSASAMEMYRKRYKGISPAKVVDFLILNEEFPRAARSCLNEAFRCLRRLPVTMHSDSSNSAQDQLGALVTGLGAVSVEKIIQQGLHEFLDDLQYQLSSVHRAVAQNFFPECGTAAMASETRPLGACQ
ncbi:MAG: alpha-E domain-containing protein [Acidiferrobacter sp.]